MKPIVEAVAVRMYKRTVVLMNNISTGNKRRSLVCPGMYNVWLKANRTSVTPNVISVPMTVALFHASWLPPKLRPSMRDTTHPTRRMVPIQSICRSLCRYGVPF